MIHIVCSSNEGYLPRMKSFLDTVVNLSGEGIKIWLVCVGCDVPEWVINDYPYITPVTITKEQNSGSPIETESVQHGSFLSVIDYAANDTIIYSDGDIVIQRPFTESELLWLKQFPKDTIGASWNSGEHEKLTTEGARLSPKMSEVELTNTWGQLIYHEPCFNVGVLVARGATWKKLYTAYMKDWQTACDSFYHQARQQWLICFERAYLGLKYQILPSVFHTHGHYNMPSGLYSINHIACIDGMVICFRHRF